MSREHYCMKLTSAMKETDGQPVTLFVDTFAAMWAQKDGTCKIETTVGEFHVKESEETIITKAKGYGIINKVD